MAIAKVVSEYATRHGAGAPEKKDCVVRAISLAVNVAYAEVHAALAAQGRETGKSTYARQTLTVVESYGMQQVPTVRPTLQQFIRENRQGRYVVIRRGHAFALIDGVVHDWNGSKTGPRSRVLIAFILMQG